MNTLTSRSRCVRTMSIVVALLWCAVSTPGQDGRYPSYATDHAPPDGWPGQKFVLSQSYPTAEPPAVPEPGETPWMQYSFATQPEQYLRAVLNYAVEGNDTPDVDWDVRKNPIRGWYHAPWLHPGCGGREYQRGMTRERRSRPEELYPDVTETFDNWAVGIYNAPGGYTLGQVWGGAEPDPALSKFPIGTVAMKLLFTTATPDEVPFLQGSLEWDANIYPNAPEDPCPHDKKTAPPPRENTKVYLLQIDVAVRDARKNGTTGWVFGTFIYDGSRTAERVWDRMAHVGIAWTNDPDVTSELNREGAFVNPDLDDNLINADLIPHPDMPAHAARMMHLGLGGRLNGPVDNPISGCMSCHGRGTWPPQPMVPSNTSVSDYTEAQFDEYFAEVPPGVETFELDGVTYTRTDYSLQVAVGIRNYHKYTPPGPTSTVAESALAAAAELPEFSLREGAPPTDLQGASASGSSLFSIRNVIYAALAVVVLLIVFSFLKKS